MVTGRGGPELLRADLIPLTVPATLLRVAVKLLHGDLMLLTGPV